MIFLGWILLGAVLAGCLVAFWDDIRNWLNNTAADVVEKYLGYDARKLMHRSTVVIDRVVNTIRNRTVVYSKKNRLDTVYDKVTLSADASVYSISKDVLKEIEEKGKLVQEYEYKG